MGQRVIPVAVTAEYIGGDGVTLGAAGSHNSVLIEYDFRSAGPQWDDISGRYVLWTNPQGNSTNRINLGVSEKVDGYEGVYQAAPPADAMCVPGWAEMVVVGFTLDGDKEITKIKTEPSRFRVLPGSSRASDNEGVAATVADQLQAEIEAVDKTLQEKVADLNDRKVNKPTDGYDPDGTPGQMLLSLGSGKTMWSDFDSSAVETALEKHPEWTTTVDFAVTYKTLDTALDMVADATLSDGDHVMTSGYYAANDGGAAKYKIREIVQEDDISETADGTTSKDGLVRLTQSGLCAELITNGRLNFLCAGVKRDTGTDQFMAFYRALHIPGVHHFYLPSGRYVISNTICVPPDSEFYGDGKATDLYFDGTYTALGGAIGNGGSNVAIHDISVNHLAHKQPEKYQDDTIFMYASDDPAQQPTSFLNGIGFACGTFDGWSEYIYKNMISGEGMSAGEIEKNTCRNLRAYRIWSDSCYPLQTEPAPDKQDSGGNVIDGCGIQDVIYRDIYAPNGLVRLYPQVGKGTLKNVFVDNVNCFVFRVGNGTPTGENINLNNITAKLAILTTTGMRVNNMNIIGITSGQHCNWTWANLRVATDNISLDNVNIVSGTADEQTHGINLAAQYAVLSSVAIKGFTGQTASGANKRPLSNGGCDELYCSNCDIDGIISAFNGKAVNCRGSFPLTMRQEVYSAKTYTVADDASVSMPFRACGVLFAQRNSVEASATNIYLINNSQQQGLIFAPMNVESLLSLSATFDSETGMITFSNDSGAYVFLSLIAF